MATPKIRVAIIGAGLTGLLTAHGLKKNGFDVVVFEREKTHGERRRDWSILLHWGMPMFTKLLPESTIERLPEAICNPHLTFDEYVESIRAVNGKTGEQVFRNPTPGARRITRQRLRTVLLRDLEEAGVIRWGQRLVNIEAGESGPVKLAFEDGSTHEADYVLGADGASSKVRELLFKGNESAKVQYSGFMFASVVAKYGDAEKVETFEKSHPVTTILFGEDSVGGFGTMHADSPDDKSQWEMFWVKVWRRDGLPVPEDTHGQKALEYLKMTTKNWVEPYNTLVQSTPDNADVHIDHMKVWTSKPFDNLGGRVTLAGDAGHPMLPYRGQGFQHAILDATKILDALLKIRDEGAPASEVITEYDKDMVERGAKAVQQSIKEAELSMDLKTVNQMLMARKGHGKDVE